MPGRFPLIPVALTGDRFCDDQFCGDPTLNVGSGTIAYPNPVYVTNTISGVPSCAGGRISWYRVNPSTGNRSLITQYSSTYTPVSDDIGFAISADVECPDPNSPTGFGTPGTAGTTSVIQPPFNPAAYTWFRWTGTLRKNANYGIYFNMESIPVTSAWRNTENNNYGYIILRGISGAGVSTTLNSGIWGAELSFYLNGFNGYSIDSCGYVQDANFGPSFIYMRDFGAAVTNASYSDLAYEVVDGRWQFSNDQSTVLAEWNGL